MKLAQFSTFFQSLFIFFGAVFLESACVIEVLVKLANKLPQPSQ